MTENESIILETEPIQKIKVEIQRFDDFESIMTEKSIKSKHKQVGDVEPLITEKSIKSKHKQVEYIQQDNSYQSEDSKMHLDREDVAQIRLLKYKSLVINQESLDAIHQNEVIKKSLMKKPRTSLIVEHEQDKYESSVDSESDKEPVNKLISLRKVMLVRTKDKNNNINKNKTDFYPAIYLEGEFNMVKPNKELPLGELLQNKSINHHMKVKRKQTLLFNLLDFSKESFPFSEKLNSKHEENSELISIFNVSLFFSKLFNYSQLVLSQFEKFLSKVDLDSFFVFLVQSELMKNTNMNQKSIHNMPSYISNLIKNINKSTLVSSIPNYIKFLLEAFWAPLSEYKENFLDDLISNSDIAECLTKHAIYSDFVTITNKIFNFFVLKPCVNLEEHNLQENLFYVLLIKIEHFFKNFYPYCCGKKNYDKIIYFNNPFVFCHNCKTLVCSKCFKNHKSHSYFDFASFLKKKNINIHLDENMDEDELNDSHNKPSENDFIMNHILTIFNSKIIRSYLNDMSGRLTVLDFMEIFLIEHLYKLVYLINEDKLITYKNSISHNITYSVITNFAKIDSDFSDVKKEINLNKKDQCEKSSEMLNSHSFYVNTISSYRSKKLQSNNNVNKKIVDNIYYNKVSTELNVSKNLIMSNYDLTYEVPVDNFALMISGGGSPTALFSKLGLPNKKSENEVLDSVTSMNDKSAKFLNKNMEFNNRQSALYNYRAESTVKTNNTDKKHPTMKFFPNESNQDKSNPVSKDNEVFEEMTKSEARHLTSLSFKYNVSHLTSLKIKSNKTKVDNLSPVAKTSSSKKIKNKKYPSLDLEQIVSSLHSQKDTIEDLDIVTTDENGISKFKDGFESKYEIVSMYIRDLLSKLANYGRIKY